MLAIGRELSTQQFDELAIADLTDFQIAVPTTAKDINRPFFSAQLPVPQREYAPYGWLILGRRVAGQIDQLRIGALESYPLESYSTEGRKTAEKVAEAIFKPIKRLTASIPLSFQLESPCPLPCVLAARGSFAYQFPGEPFPHRAIFRQIVPRFVRIYPFWPSATQNSALLNAVDRMLADEAAFIAKNYEQLRLVPFYRDRFDL